MLVTAACSNAHGAATSQASAAAAVAPSPEPLHACEVREVDFDAGRAVVSSNADGSLATVRVIEAKPSKAAAQVTRDAVRRFGPIRIDRTIVPHKLNMGSLTTYTDRCGHTVTPVTP